MEKNKNPKSEHEFKHHTTIGPNGEILYDAPIIIRDKEDLENYGISWKDCCTLPFGGSKPVTVYIMQLESREVADLLWSDIDTQHSREYANSRCWVEGVRKAYIRCPGTVSCSSCPNRDKRLPPFISLDELVESGYEPAYVSPVEEQTAAKLEYKAIRDSWNAKDPRIAIAFEMKELYGFSAEEIGAVLHVSASRIYQLNDNAKTIGKAYMAEQ